jgi:hypothetical protein
MGKVYILIGVLSTLTVTAGVWAVMARIAIPMFRGRKKNRKISK